ncbi:sensor domain-containing diguanylate cyclase [Viridibacillus sp. YIM B01967]|uniref:Sensor domain-containing diguanylate cyclase n=1 Tax=Viridibacillus soli TaxID=2798301 RepID=A0ABS1H366_9BACL|nr:sensor domain-containing diguanylate cyclase [Viridibacillus soli]MBK3493602.1 sensor domain-containing diguanylate cyclase [Viridibacillus soli]
MTQDQQTMQNIKCQILDLWTDLIGENLNNDEYLTLLKEIFFQYFDITNSEYLYLGKGMYFPVSVDAENGNITNGIPFAVLEPYFHQQYQFPNAFISILKEKYDFADDAILLRDANQKPFGIIILQKTERWRDFATTKHIHDFVVLISSVIQLIQKNYKANYEKKLNKELVRMTGIFHSSMDIDRILKAVLQGVSSAFPTFKSKLILSNDQDRHLTVDTHMFDYMSERTSTIEAFVSGDMTIEQATDLKCRLLNAPIKGRQGIYAVLQIFAPYDYVFVKREKDFIKHIAQTSGNALENAKLYHQSHRLVSDLQLINETSHRLNMKLNQEEMLVFLAKQLTKSFSPNETCFVLKGHDEYQVTTGSTAFFFGNSCEPYLKHVTDHFERSTDPLFVADFSNLVDDKVAFMSMMAIPIIIREKVHGFSIVLHNKPYFFSFDSFKLMQSLIRHSSLAISNTILREQLQEMVDRDHLTKLFARKYLDRYVEMSMDKDESGVFVLMDIDNFKMVNDTYGHQTGDAILVTIARHLTEMVQGKGICARWGGEEIAVYLPNQTFVESIDLVGKIIASIPKVTVPSVTVSSGVAVWHKELQANFQSVFQNADIALYEAKNNGKNQFRLFQTDDVTS